MQQVQVEFSSGIPHESRFRIMNANEPGRRDELNLQCFPNNCKLGFLDVKALTVSALMVRWDGSGVHSAAADTSAVERIAVQQERKYVADVAAAAALSQNLEKRQRDNTPTALALHAPRRRRSRATAAGSE